MSGTPAVWLAGADEAETVAALLVGFRDHLGLDWPSENAFLASVERLIEDNGTEFLLGAPDLDTPPAGVVQLRFQWSVWKAAHDCLVEDVFVADSARGVGLGRALMELAVERARERGCRRMQLDTNETNAAAIALYESLGFSASRGIGGEGRDIFLRLPLEPPAA